MKFNTRYNLRRQDSRKPEKIYLICRFSGERLVYPTCHSVLPKHWNTGRGEVKNVIDETNRDSVKNYLYELNKVARGFYNEAVASRYPVTEIKEIIKKNLDRWTGRVVEEKPEKPNFWKFVNNYIETSDKRIDPRTGRFINFRTIQDYNTTVKVLHELEKETGETIDFDNISVNTLSDYRDFLTTRKGYAVNNIAKHINNVRQFLRAAYAQKIPFDTDTIDTKKFINAHETAYNVYLNENELLAIAALDLTENPSLDKARDLFLMGCYTGLRISDYNNMQRHHIKGNMIDLYQSKTGGRVVIPIHPTVKAILAKYEGGKLPKLSDQKLNDYIKEVCQMAEIKEHTEKQQTKGGAKISTVLEKWQMVSSHTARRSFATNMIKQGVPMQTIMSITGHKKESTFMKYVKLSSAEHAEIMRQHWDKNEQAKQEAA